VSAVATTKSVKPKSMKTKSMMSRGGRKLAASAGRGKQKSGGEPQKPTTRSTQRTGSSKQRKG